jgi:hypothetical protein
MDRKIIVMVLDGVVWLGIGIIGVLLCSKATLSFSRRTLVHEQTIINEMKGRQLGTSPVTSSSYKRVLQCTLRLTTFRVDVNCHRIL